MSKENKNVKICGVKKVNKMSKEICISELARINGMNKNKDGVNMGDYSIYRDHVSARLAELEGK